MNWSFYAKQALTIARLEAKKAFFSRRGLWVYLLALFPCVIFLGHAIEVKYKQGRWSGQRVTEAALLENLPNGISHEDVRAKLGEPISENVRTRRNRPERRWMTYYDGSRQHMLRFEDGRLIGKGSSRAVSLEEDSQVFAGVFQYFYLRLAIFFGCLGIFINLFRGEMLDKTLHFWFLAPARREVLLVGKYGAGLLASTVIFGGAAILTFLLMLWPQNPTELSAYWNGPGPSHLFWYATAAVLGCVGYGSVFLAAGLLVRNPILPAVVMLIWEGANGFLPAWIQKLSVLYYLQSLCPFPPPMESDVPALLKLLLSPAEPAPAWGAVLGIVGVTCLVLFVASRSVRRLEINYSTE